MVMLTVDIHTVAIPAKLYSDYGCTDRGSADYGSSALTLCLYWLCGFTTTDYVAALTMAVLAMRVPLLWLYGLWLCEPTMAALTMWLCTYLSYGPAAANPTHSRCNCAASLGSMSRAR